MANDYPAKCLLKSDALKEYILKTSAYPREHEQLKEIRNVTAEKYPDLKVMNVPADEGQLLSMFVKVMNAKRTLEIGVFTGYSLLATALALPDDAQITAIDKSREFFEAGLPFIKKAGVEHKINFIESDAMEYLQKKTSNENQNPEFDFIFVDATKTEYLKYHQHLKKMVKIGGVIAYDNTLWFGYVVEEENEVPDKARLSRKAILELNINLASDPCMEICQLSVGDGVTLCRRVS